MTTLPNGCTCSKLSVTPKNWQSKSAKLNNGWFIIYRFYDSRNQKPKQVMVKGMNQLKNLQERQEATKKALDSLVKIKQFIDRYGNNLKNKKNVTILQDSKNEFIGKFGLGKYPSLYVYSAQKKLMRYDDNEKNLPAFII
jgi:spore germination cell wall hydrolase CwlJ-like protein